MLSQRAVEASSIFTRRDLSRLLVAAVLLVAALSGIFALDLFPRPLEIQVGDVASADIVAPRTDGYVSKIQTQADKDAASTAVAPVYDYSSEKALRIAGVQLKAFEDRVKTVDTAFDPATKADVRSALLEAALPGLTEDARVTLVGLKPDRWKAVRAEASRVLDATEIAELKDSSVDQVKVGLTGQMAGGLDEGERTLAAQMIAPLVVPNSSYSPDLTAQAKVKAADLVPDRMINYAQNETIVRKGEKVTPLALEAITEFGLTQARVDLARLGGWILLAILIVGVLMGWIWRFRSELWHRANAMFLIGLIVVGTTLILKLTAGRPGLPFLVPTAAAAMLLAILLDAGVAVAVTAVLALLGGVVNGSAPEMMAYILFGGLAGIIAIRRGDRLQIFLQAGLVVAIVNVLVVAMYGFLGSHDARGVIELMGAALVSAAGSAVAAVGTFAVLGSVFGILTVFQLLELANPSQPLLRRLLVETPGTYHHSLMVGNLAERAAEAIGADPLLTRVAAYYHDIGKLANPLAFIENQSGGENVHDQLDPETSAQVLKQHVVDGIDIAYKAKLPKSLIAFIPQHHGTAIMSYFYARAKGLAAEPYGGPQTSEGARAAATVDERKFRHAGPKPQSREAALIMLADGVEASVRSLASRDEPAIRAMVARIIDERMADGQFDECDLTLRDVEKIKEAFVQQLLGMYHQRIAYPQNKVVELESRRGTGTGTGA
ncbi:MAG TPA: HDIG domain-containing protein [Candidatus Bathyarchaeia archaeon]|jgi:putative nucleotidyltransferase with HDIG domain|nr:HDIG domain-containing protein [Candidatus Bathyarchaeia archaeon]